jgi:hypothetical protein
MNRTKFLKGACQHCGGHLEFPAEMVGLAAPCPHCGQQTDLLLATPPETPSVPRKALVWMGVTVLILGLGLAGAMIALKRAERWALRQKKAAPVQTNAAAGAVGGDSTAIITNGFKISPIGLEKTTGSALVYAIGTVQNRAKRQRFGVRVELDLYDASQRKIGTAKDYVPVLEPGADWNFKALVVDANAAAAKLATIHED